LGWNLYCHSLLSGLSYTCLGIILSVPICRMGSSSCPKTCMYAHIFQIWVSIVRCRSHPHESSNTQACQPLQFAEISFACNKLYSRPPHSGSTGLTTRMNIQCNTFGFSPQVFLNVPLQVQKNVLLVRYLIPLLLPSQSLV
jgi:hypothetical protein